MTISVLAPNGSVSGTATEDLGTNGACDKQAQALVAHRTHITSTALLATCDPFGNMFRLSITPEGTLTTLPEVDAGTFDACLAQATTINSQ
jgi:hypothetical protein